MIKVKHDGDQEKEIQESKRVKKEKSEIQKNEFSDSDSDQESEYESQEEEFDVNQQELEDAELDEKMKDLSVYLPGDKLEKDHELVVDQSTYELLHHMNVEWPCLSFDVIKDKLGDNRTAFPMTSYIVAGSQADSYEENKVYVMKMSKMHKTMHDDDSDASDEEDQEGDAVLEYRTIKHPGGGVNRIRVMPDDSTQIVATMAESGAVNVFDTTMHFDSFDTPGLIPPKDPKPIWVADCHKGVEGFAIDWSRQEKGQLLTGDNSGAIYLSRKTNDGFKTDPKSFKGHLSSVEDINWSPTQSTVFASCSSDQTIRVWDIRTKSKPQLTIHAATSDVNVISWNRKVDYLVASGHDDGSFSIWDLRSWPSTTSVSSTNAAGWKKPDPAAHFTWHSNAVTSIEWHPTESSVLVVSGSDDQVTLWDLALEADEETETLTRVNTETGEKEQVVVPPQLLFVHQGQKWVKEVHWHNQLDGVVLTSAFDGFNVFKTFNMA